MLKCVTDGIFSPDVAEIVKPFLVVSLFRMNMDRVENINVTEEKFSSIDDTDILSSYKNKVMPNNRDLKEVEMEKDIMELVNQEESQGFMNRRIDQ